MNKEGRAEIHTTRYKTLRNDPSIRDKMCALHNKFPALFKKYIKHLQKHKLSFLVQLVEHCNLNCICCDHFCPVAETEFLDIDEFSRDIKRLRELFGDSIERVKLEGGEPLLHPKINDFMTVVRKCFGSNTEVQIITNGLLLPQMPETFWMCCRQNRVTITPTKYPVVNFNYDELEQLAHKYNVNYRYFNYFNNANNPKRMFKTPLDLNGGHEADKEFSLCHRAINCITLRHGQLYTCPVIPTVCHLNKYFGTNFNVTLKDSIDIYRTQSSCQIMQFLTHPVPFCQYCAFENKVKGIEWQESKRELSEWVL